MNTTTTKRPCNTTWSMFIANTMDTPNREQIIACMSKSLFYALEVHAQEQLRLQYHLQCNLDSSLRIFDERYYPLSNRKRDFNKLPYEEEIVRFVNFLFYKQSLSPQVGIMAVHYVDQLIHRTGLLVTPANWRRVLLCALLVADKVWEDDIVCNSQYCSHHFPLLKVDDINAMEREFLKRLDFKLILKTSVYAEYYFALRSISGSRCFPLRPLDKETAQCLLFKKTLSQHIKSNNDNRNSNSNSNSKNYCNSNSNNKRRRSISLDQIAVDQQCNNTDNSNNKNKQPINHHKVREEIDAISLEQFTEQLAGRSIR